MYGNVCGGMEHCKIYVPFSTHSFSRTTLIPINTPLTLVEGQLTNPIFLVLLEKWDNTFFYTLYQFSFQGFGLFN